MKYRLLFHSTIIIGILISIGCKKDETGTTELPVTVSNGNNKSLFADAGPDQSITIIDQYPKTYLNGSGSYDTSGTALQFTWRQISGPANCSILNPGQKQTEVYNILTPGIYSFELKVWNNNGTDFDTTNVTVLLPNYCQSDRAEVPVTLTFLSNLPENIQGFEIIGAGEKLIILAGLGNLTGAISNKVYLYDLVSNNWITIKTSLARIGVAIIAAGNKLFFAGGVSELENYRATSIVDIYDLTTNTWSVSNLSEARGYCQATVLGNKIFFAGGLLENNSLSNKVDIYSLETNTWVSTELNGDARQVGAAITVQNKVLFCGGYTAYEDLTGFGFNFTTPTTDIDIYDNNTNQWSTSSMQVKKGSFSAIGVNEKVYFAGGFINNALTSHVEEWNVNTMIRTKSCLFQPFESYGGKNAAIKNNVLIFLTNPQYAGTDRNKFDIYDLNTGIWSVGVLQPGLVSENPYSPVSITSLKNDVYSIIGTKLYKINL